MYKNGGKEKTNGDNKQNGGDVVEFTLKRVMKNLNNYILNEYQKLFFSAIADQDENNSDSNPINGGGPSESKSRSIRSKDFFSNPTLLKKANEELRFCEDKSVSA